MPNNNSGLYGTTSNVTVSANNLTTLYNTTPGNVVTVSVPDRNLTTLYPSATTEVNPTRAYGNANVERFLNAGTDGGNTITNIIASGNITANYYFGNGYYLTGVGNASNATTANFAFYAGNVTVNNQPNITSLGTLTGLSVNGVSNLGNIGNVHITGGSANYALITDGNGNLSWGQVANASNAANANYANFAGTAFNVSGSNVSGTVANANYSAYAGNATVANSANSVAGANVTGQVSYAAVANSVSVGNVVGIGNIATLNLDGNVSNILHGNGYWGPETSSGNANYANFAGTAFSVSGSNVVGDVAGANHANIADVANSVAGSNVSGQVANALVAGTVYTNAQPNITSVGNLISLTVTGNLTSGNANLGNLAIANYFSGDGGLLSNISAANVVGNLPVRFQVKNTSGVTLTKGTPIYVTGTVGATTTVEVAASRADTSSTMGCVGLLEQDLNNNDFGYAISIGTLTSVDTSTYTVGDELYVGATGGITNTRPTNSNLVQPVGTVGRVNLNTGSIEVNIWDIYSLPNLNNGNIWIGNSGNGYPVQQTLATSTVANANYANFAGTLINGTSNVTIPSANGNIQISVNGNANIGTFDSAGTGALTLNPLISQNNGLRISSVGRNGTGNGASRLTWIKSRGTLTTPLSVEPTDFVAEILGVGHNGTATQTNSLALIRAQVDSSYTANGANIPLGWQIVVNDTNGGVNNQSKQHSFYSNGNVSFANAIFATTVNGTLIGDGGNISNITGANVTGQVAYAAVANSVAGANVSGEVAYAAVANSVAGGNVSGQVANALIAGTVYTNAQPNITSTGNLVSVAINNGVAATPTYQVQPNGIAIGTTANLSLAPYAGKVTIDYGNGQLDGNLVLTSVDSMVRYRGNSTSPTAVSQNDRIYRQNHYAYNGTSNVLAAGVTTVVANTNANANAVFSGGSYQIATGNPVGDTGNANATSAINTLTFDQWGRLVIQQGSAPAGSGVNGILAINNYGGTSGNASATSAIISFNRYRGNRDANLSVQQSDQLGRIGFLGYNGTSVATNRFGQIRAVVDSSYVANTANIPIGLGFDVCDNTTQYSHLFYANGNVQFAKSATILGNTSISGGNLTLSNSSSGGTVFNLYGDKTPNSSFDMSGVQFSSTMSNVDLSTGFSPFRFQQYSNVATAAPWYIYRSRGTDYFNPANVQANDGISTINLLVQSNNSTVSVGGLNSYVVSNDNAGNVGMRWDISAYGTGTSGYANGYITLNANTTFADNINANTIVLSGNANVGNLGTSGLITATGNITGGNLITSGTLSASGNSNIANLQLNKFQETVYSIGTTSGTITPDFNNGSIQTMTLNGNVTINSLGNALAGRSMTLIITQDGTGNRTLTSSMKFSDGYNILSTSAGATDIMFVFYDGSTYYASLSTGYV